MNRDMTLEESTAWLHQRYRDRMVGQQYDKVRWAGNVFSSDEEKCMEMAYILNDQAEYDALERYQDQIGMM